VAAQFQQQRQRAGLTQEAAARALGISAETMTNWEAGFSEPKVSQLLDMAKLYRVDPSVLLTRAPELTQGQASPCNI
jgi:transcriptional regulator with XRE-family HTH domain